MRNPSKLRARPMAVWLASLVAALLLTTGITSCLSLRNLTGPNRVKALGSVTVAPASVSLAVGG